MKAIAQQKGHNYVADDASGLMFNEVTGKDDPPTHLTAAICDGQGGEMRIPLDLMLLLGKGVFGAARTCRGLGAATWTGAGRTFFVYAVAEPYDSVVIVANHSGGTYAWVLRHAWDLVSWRDLCVSLTPEKLWDLCHTVTDAYDAGKAYGHGQVTAQFLEGRLKRRKTDGAVSVEVVAAEVPEKGGKASGK